MVFFPLLLWKWIRRDGKKPFKDTTLSSSSISSTVQIYTMFWSNFFHFLWTTLISAESRTAQAVFHLFWCWPEWLQEPLLPLCALPAQALSHWLDTGADFVYSVLSNEQAASVISKVFISEVEHTGITHVHVLSTASSDYYLSKWATLIQVSMYTCQSWMILATE